MVSVRILGALGLAVMAGGAQASSIVVLGASTSTPSVVRLGTSEPVKMADAAATQSRHAAPAASIVAIAGKEPDVTYEKVAAIPDQPEPKHGFPQNPMIIRGGIVGGDFATPAPAKVTASAGANSTPTANSKSQPQPAPAPIPTAGKPRQ